jgi:uncharacterized protein YjcR
MQPNCLKKCLARTRKGSSCQSPVVRCKNRCRMHGGAKGSGAPLSNRNAFKHGEYSAVAIRTRQELQALLKQNAEVLRNI